VERARLALEVRDDLRFQRGEPRLVDRLALPRRAFAHHDLHRACGLLGAHHRGLRGRPAEDEARPERATAHAVVAGAERGAALHRDLRHRRVRERLDLLRAVLDHAGALGLAADDEAGRVLQPDDRLSELAARLHEVRDLRAAGGVERPVVGDDADAKPGDLCVPAHRVRTVVGLELEKVRRVDDPRDHVAHVDRLLGIGAEDAEQLLGIEEGRRSLGPGRARLPAERRDELARLRERARVVVGDVLGEPGDGRVHVGAAERLVGRDLAGRRLQERRPGEERAGAAADHDDVVAEPGHVRAARGRRAVHDADHRQPGGRQPREIAEERAAADELLDAVLEQVRSRRFDQVHERQLVVERDLLRAQQLLEALRLQRAGVDAGVVGDDEDAHARDDADADDGAAAGDRTLAARTVVAEAGERRELEERHAGVEQPRDAFARQQLAAALEERRRLRARRARRRLDRSPLVDQRERVRAVGGERVALGVELDRERGHVVQASRRTRGVVARWKPSNGEVDPPVPTSGQMRLAFGAAPSTRRHAPETNAAAGVRRKTIAAEPRSRCRAAAAARAFASCGSSPSSRVDSGRARSKRSSRGRPR
jgi:hypothetical protein